MNTFKKIYLIWRVSKSKPRIIVGELAVDSAGTIDFKYTNTSETRQSEFKGYPGLRTDTQNHSNVLNLFSKRLINTKRTDSVHLLDFWEIDNDKKDDKLYILAMTQGLTSIDNFEFLADFDMHEELCFVTDIAGLSHSNYDLGKLEVGDSLNFKKEVHKDDKYAVRVLFGNEKVGYIKQIHNRVFYKEGAEKLKIKVKSIVNNNEMKSLFVKVYL